MKAFHVLLALALLATPAAFAHKPPGPVTTCQFGGDRYHDYLPPNLGFVAIPRDGNLGNCVFDSWAVGPLLEDNAAACQVLKSNPLFGSVHAVLCQEIDTNVPRTFLDYDGELDHAYGGAILAVNTGDGATWGAGACWGMAGHHSNNVYAQEWPDGSGPAFTVTSDHSRTPPGKGPKGPRTDCGDNVIEPCNNTPPSPSTQPFPVGVIVDTVNAQLYSLFGPGGNGTTCNVNDCGQVTGGSTSSGPSHMVVLCAPGIDGTYSVWIEPDLNAPDVPLFGHVWTY